MFPLIYQFILIDLTILYNLWPLIFTTFSSFISFSLPFIEKWALVQKIRLFLIAVQAVFFFLNPEDICIAQLKNRIISLETTKSSMGN